MQAISEAEVQGRLEPPHSLLNNVLWAIFVLPYVLALIVICVGWDYLQETFWRKNLNQDMREPCERGYFDKASQKVIVP